MNEERIIEIINTELDVDYGRDITEDSKLNAAKSIIKSFNELPPAKSKLSDETVICSELNMLVQLFVAEGIRIVMLLLKG